MMLRTGDLNLNQFGGSLKEAVKRTMIQHEIIFKNQVRELHRLYWTQNNLVQELYRKELGANNCREMRTSQSQMSGNVGCTQETKGQLVDIRNSRRRGFDLELPADDYIASSADDSICDVRLIGGPDMVKPVCSTKHDVDEKGVSVRSFLDKGKTLFCYEVIDLEEPVEVDSDVEAYRISMDGFKVPVGRGLVNGSDFASSSRVQNESGYLLPLSNLNAGGSKSVAAAVVDRSTDSTHKRDPSPKPILIDLNMALDEDPSEAFNNPILTIPSPSSSSSAVQNELLWKGQVSELQKEISGTPLLATAENNQLSPDSQDSQRSRISDVSQQQETEMLNKVLKSMSQTECYERSAERLSTDSNRELSNSTMGKSLSSAGFSGLAEENGEFSFSSQHCTRHRDINLQASISNDLQNKQANLERSDEDTVSSHVVALKENQQGHGHIGSTLCSSLEGSAEQNSGTTQLGNTDSESSQDMHNTEQQHSETQTVVDAAEILANLYLAKLPSPLAQLDGEVLIEEKGSDQPQYSTDSFEAMTLELPEAGSGEHLITEWTTQTGNSAGGEDTSRVNRLRSGRGRVVRDFQKDILPGMVSLSRHEIREDLHSIGYELRKSGSRKSYGGNWFLPARSRRSRRYPVRKRL